MVNGLKIAEITKQRRTVPHFCQNASFLYQLLGDGTQPFPQHPFTFITSGPPPNSAGLPGNTRAPGPHDMIYSPQSFVGQIVAQPLGSHHGMQKDSSSVKSFVDVKMCRLK